MHHTQDKTKNTVVPHKEDPLPLRADRPDLGICDPPQKDISKTAGGKITDAVIYKGMGFVGNSGLSIAVTYFLMSKKKVKNFITATTEGAQSLFKGSSLERPVGRVVEILFMIIAGTILTACMAPLVTRREKIAHWVNQKLGKDTDVLPSDMQTFNQPHTLEDKVEQELKKRINYGQTSRDLWKARWTSLIVPIVGEGLLSDWNARREKQVPAKWSTDGLSWKAGQYMYDEVLKPQSIAKFTRFLSDHGAGIEDIRAPDKNGKIPESYTLLENAEKRHIQRTGEARLNTDRMVIAEQSRLLGKEVGWTIITSAIMERLTHKFQDRRIRKQEAKAIAKMREEGIIPVGIHVVTDKEGHVKLTKTKHYVPPVLPDDHGIGEVIADAAATHQLANNKVKQVTALPEKAASHIEAVHTSKLRGDTAPSLG